ncbi:MAG: TrkH family potassium uptake protein [Pirellulales bacterium]|nr:TrkH family potassium uptake protein [Pirellulales bacterium]
MLGAMNRLLICRLLGLIALLIGASMLLSLPWAFPLFGQVDHFDSRSVIGFLGSMAVCGLVGGVLMRVGRSAAGERLFRREAIAVVGLSWLLATVLGAMPFWFTGTCSGRNDAGEPVAMNLVDGLFESASGFSGTGSTVLTKLQDRELIPRAVLFWRSQTHFLGGLGIMVLFVAILGMGSAGKALMLTEMPGPAQESAHARSQRAAWVFASIFVGLTLVLSIILKFQGMDVFDALCHSFGTIATGGFSTYDDSVAHFNNVSIEMTIMVFMIIACTNFTLLYYVLIWRPGKLLADIEFRTYLIIMATVMLLIVGFGLHYENFAGLGDAFRYGSFQVASIMTNTGFGTADFDKWNSFGRGLLLLLMFIGGCAGSTSCSVKVIRYILFFKILGLELEHIFHPSVVRHVRLGGKPLPDPDLRKDVLVYFAIILLLFLVAWLLVVALEPDETWAEYSRPNHDKLTDCASAVAATLNGVGPGLGIVGESQNYAHFHWPTKLILTWMMLLGRLEVFVLLVLFVPRFWRRR